VVSIVIPVLTVIPSGKIFSIRMRGVVNDIGRVITSGIVHECVSCMPGGSLGRCFVRVVMSR